MKRKMVAKCSPTEKKYGKVIAAVKSNMFYVDKACFLDKVSAANKLKNNVHLDVSKSSSGLYWRM